MSNEVTKHGQYDFYIGDEPYRDILDFMRQHGMLQQGCVTPLSMPANPEAEAESFAMQDPIASSCFEIHRKPVRNALRTIVDYIFDRFNLPRNKGFDIGCGATGEMVEELLPDNIDRNSWVQIDVNPSAVRENKNRHPDAKVQQGSYLHVDGVRNLNIITGLSSLDSTYFISKAIEQIRQALKKGGYLLHVQDVGPGKGYGWGEARYMGLEPPYEIEIIRVRNRTGGAFTYWVPHQQKYISVGELFRRNFGRAIENNPGMELIFNKWVNARRVLNSGPARWYFLNILLQNPSFPPELLPVEDVSAVVTVARRIS